MTITLGRILLTGGLAVAGATQAGSFEPTQKLTDVLSTDVAMADFDGDGDVDVVTSHYLDYVQLWLNDGTGQVANSGMDLGNNYTARIRVADVNDDAAPDLLLGGSSSYLTAGAHLLENDGGGNFSPIATFETNGEDTGDWAIGDLDGDTHLDVVVLTYDRDSTHSTLAVWYGESGGFAQMTNTASTDNQYELSDSQCKSLGLANLDGDATADLVVGCDPSGNGANAGGIQVWEHNGSDLASAAGLLPTDWDIGDIVFADIDGNGHKDVIGTHFNSSPTTSASGNEHSVWMNTGTSLSAGALDFNGQRAVVADLNSDGQDDLVVADGRVTRHYAGIDGTTEFDDRGTLESCNAYAVAVAAGDLNNDSKVDLAIASSKNFSSDEKNDLILLRDGTNGVCPSSGGGSDGGGSTDSDDDSGADEDSGGDEDGGGGGGALPVWLLAMLPVLALVRRRG